MSARTRTLAGAPGALLVVMLLALAPAVAWADGDDFELFPDFRAQATFSCQDLTVSGDAIVNSLGLATGDAEIEQGHLRSNADIILNGTVEVHGDALAGPGDQVILNGGPLVTGTIGNADADLGCYPVDLAALEALLDQANDNDQIPLSLNGNDVLGGPDRRRFKIVGNDSLTLPAGTYIFSSLEIGGGSTVEVDGEVRILVTGTVKINGGGLFNQADSPFLLRLWSSGATFKVDSQSLLRGFVYAPAAGVQLKGGAEVQGAVFAGSVDIGGGAFLTRIIDDVPPLLTITSPADGDTLTECEVEVTGEVTDAETVVILVINDNPVTVADDGTFAAVVSLWTDPPGHITATATDGGGNETLVEVQVSVLPPVVTLEAPAPGSLVDRRVIDLSGSAGTATEVTVNGVPANVADGAWQIAAFDLGVDGLKPLEIIGTNCGGSGVTNETLDLDTTSPVVTVTSPAEGAVIGEGTVTVTGTVIDAHLAMVTVNDLAATVVGDAFTATGVPLVEGINTLTVTATDGVGLSTTVQLSVTMDTLAPIVWITTPPDGALTANQPITVTGEFTEANLATLKVNGFDATLTGSQFSAEIGLVEGPNTITVVATDVLDRFATAEITVTLDTTEPGITIAEPVNGFVTDTVSITVSGSFSEVLSSLTVNELAATFADGSFSIDDVPLDSEGDNLIVATATDLVGISALSLPTLVVRDTLAPDVTMDTAALPALTATEMLIVTGTAADPHLASVMVAGAAATIAGDQWTVELTLAEGDNVLVATAEDSLGHSAQTPPFTVVLDTQPPAISITSPASGTDSSDATVTVEGTVSDPNLDEVTVTVNGSLAVVTGGLFTLSLDLPEGETTLVAQAADTLGQVGTSSPVTVTVDITPPVVTLTEPLEALVSTPLVDVAGTVSDPHLDQVTVSGIEATVTDTAFTVVGLPLYEGSNLLEAVATDTFGHSATSNQIEYVLDTTPPVVTITSPPEGGVLVGDVVTVTGTAIDANLASVAVNGLPATVVDGSFTVENVPLTEGENVLTAVAGDLVNLTGSASVTVVRNTAPPVVAIVEPPVGSCLPAGQPVTAAGTVFSPILSSGEGGAPLPLVLEVMTTDGGIVSYPGVIAPDGRSWIVDAFDPGSADGTAILTATATDTVGRTGVAASSLRVDATPPQLMLLLDGAPFPGAAAGNAPPPGTVPVLLGRTVAARVSVADGSFGAPEAVLTLGGAPYLAGTPITAEGEYLLVATATDCAGHSAPVHAYFAIDLTPPDLLSTIPEDGALLAAGIDGLSGVADSELAAATVNRLQATVSGSFFSIEPFVWSEGANTAEIVLTDAAGNSAGFQRSFTVSSIEPTVEILEGGLPIAAGAIFTRPVAPEIRSNDPEAAITATLDGAAFISGTPVDQAGDHILVATATDALGRQAIANASFTIDLAGVPVIAIISPADGAVLTDVLVTVTGNVSGSSPEVTVNGVPAVVSGDSWTAADLALEPDNLNIITAVARDVAGRTATASVTVMVSTGGPQILILEPVDGAVTNRSVVDVAGVVVGGARRTADGTVNVAGLSTTLDPEGAFRTLDVPLTAGANTIVAEVTGPEGRLGQDVVTIHTDLEPPAISLLADGQPLEEGAVFGGAVTVRVEVSDNAGEPPPPVVRLNGGLKGADGPTVDIPVEADGGYVVAVAAADAAGNERRAERSFSVNSGGCALTDLEPSSGSGVAEDVVTIRGRSGSAVAVSIRVPVPGTDPVEYQEYAAQLADGTFIAGDVPVLAVGDNNLELVCTDSGGGSATEELLINRLPAGDGPAVVILSPVGGDLLAGRTTTVTGTVSDPTAAMTINGLAATVTAQADGSGVFTADVPLAEGPNSLTARALDGVGRAGSDRVVVSLDTRAPTIRIITPESSSWLGPLAGGAAVVDVTGIVDLHSEPNLVDVVVSTGQGAVTAVVDPDTGVFLTGSVPLDASLAPAETQTITATATDSLGHAGVSTVGVHFDATGPALALTAPPDLASYTEASPSLIAVSGEAWAAEGAQVSVNGATLDPLSLVWDGPAADGRFHTSFSAEVSRPSTDGAFAIVARVTELDGRWAGSRRLLSVDTVAPEVLEVHPSDGSTGVAPDTLILVLFSEPVLPSSVVAPDGITLTRVGTGDPVVGQLTLAGNAAAFAAGAELATGESYRLRVGADVVDMVGHPLTAPAEATFTTSSAGAGAPPLLDPLAEVVCATEIEVTGVAAANATVQVTDGDLKFSTFADSSGVFAITVPLTHDGYHLLRVAVLDRAGDAGAEAMAVLRVDCSAPFVRSATLDVDAATINLALSEAIDPATASIGFAGAAIRLFDDEDPGDADQSATVEVNADGEGIDLLLDTAGDAWWRDTIIRLVVDAPLADPQGNPMVVPFVARLFPSGGGGVTGGFLLGEAYDDDDGRPLEGALMRLFASGSNLPGTVPPDQVSLPVAEVFTDSRGRFQVAQEVSVGRYTLVLEADGFTRVVRQLSLEPSIGAIPFDSRLTPVDAEAGILDPIAGGRLADPELPLLAFEADPVAVPGADPLTVRLTPLSGQALPDFLPLGWTPLAAAEVRLSDGGVALPDGEATPFAADAVHLELPLPEWVEPTDTLVAVRYRLAGGVWLTLADVELIDGPGGEPLARVPLAGPGAVAIVMPDAEPTAPPLPDAGAGAVLRGVERPDLLPEIAGDLILDPPVIPPTGRSEAFVVARSADGTTPWPSGIAVQAYLDERLILAGGAEQILESPYVADLVLYRPRLDPALLGTNTPESVGAMEFTVSPSERAAEVLLDVGYENIHLYPFPEQLERGQVLGPAGGAVSSADGVELSLPDGALASKTVVSASLLSAEELGDLPAVAGFDTLAGLRVELGGNTLARPATLSLDAPEGAPDAVPGDPRLVLAELIEAPADGRGAYPRLAARMGREPGGGGERLTADPEAADSGLPLEGIIREGVYLVLSAHNSIGHATGLVTMASGAGLAAARVTADGLGTADLSRLGGRYATVVPTTPGALLTALHPDLEETGSATIPAFQPGEVVTLDITVQPVPPTVVQLSPADGALEVPVGTQVAVRFSEPLDPATVGPGTLSLELLTPDGSPTGGFFAGTVELSADGLQVIFNPNLPLPPGRLIGAHFTGGVADAGGTFYADGPVDWSFTTSTVVAPGGQIHPELFHIRLPVNGVADVYGDTGALPTVGAGDPPWTVSPWINSPVADPVRDSYPANTTGGFTGAVGHPPGHPVTIDSEVWVTVIDPTGGIAAEFRLGVFATPDGRGFVAPPGEAVEFTTVDGITVEVPEGAFDVATTVTITNLDPGTVGVEDDLGLGLGGFLRLDFEGSSAEPLVLRVPAPADAPDDAIVLVGEPVSVAWGRRLRLLTVGGVLTASGGRFLSNDASVQPPIPDLTQGGLKSGGGAKGIWLNLRRAADMAWFYDADGVLALTTFLAGGGALHEAFINEFADAWFFQGPPNDWNGQVVLPVIPGAPFTVERRDTATGWLLSSQSYGSPDDPDGDGVIPLDPVLAPDPGPPRLVGARPFDLIRFAPPEANGSQLLRLDLEAVADADGKVELRSPAGFDLSPDAGVGLYEVSDPKAMKTLLGPSFVCTDTVIGPKKDPGKDLLAVVGPGSLDPGTFSEFRFTFSRAFDKKVVDPPTGRVAVLTDVGPKTSCSAATAEGAPVSITVESSSNDRVLIVRPLASLRQGRHYRLVLKTEALFPGVCPEGDDAANQPPCAAPKLFFFTTRKPSDDPVATGGAQGLDNVRTLAKIGNLLFAGTLDGRVVVTDLSGGANPAVGIHTHHAEMESGAAAQVRAFATDGHGRLFLNALFGGTWAIKAVAVEDVEAAPPGGTFPMKAGAVRTAYALGADLGSASEFLALSSLPAATPVDLEVVVRDEVDDALGLEEFCAGKACADVLDNPPDALGFYEITLAPESLSGHPPQPREDRCDWQEDTDRYQRVTLDNLTTGQMWSVDVLTAGWGGPSAPPLTFRARRGDRLRLRYNQQTLGVVALLGSGITVVDLNRFYDTLVGGPMVGLAQCGRRLGKYEGAELDLDGCGPAGQTNGIDMTPAVAALGQTTGCEPGWTCLRGAGSLHVYSPLVHRGLLHSQAAEETPGDLGQGMLSCTAGIDKAFLRDIAIARDVTWYDRGLRSSGPGAPFSIENPKRAENPEKVVGDLLFLSLGEAGIYAFDVSSRDPRLIGHLVVKDHTAFRLQVEKDLGVLLAGGWGGLLDVWDLSDVNVAPESDLADGVEAPPPQPLATLDNVPWGTDRLGVDRAGSGLVYGWRGGTIGSVAIPIRRPQPILAGVYRADGEPEGDDPPPRELRPASSLVPLGIPTELSLAKERDRRAINDRSHTAAFKVRLALPGYLGETLTAKVESLRVRPPEEHLADADIGAAKVAPGGPGWPDPDVEVTLKRLAGEEATENGRFGQAYNLYESDEIVLLIADPRASESYTPQGEPAQPGDAPVIDTEAGQCRRCERPEFLTGDTVIEMLAGGPYLRVLLEVQPGSPLESFFGADGEAVPAAIAEVAGWADDVPSPVQASLAEPPLGAAGWSPGEGGVAASLVSGESLYSMVDHTVRGRGLDFAFGRSYRSGLLGYNPLGAAGWTANLFAHLRQNPITGEVAYHDGSGNVWRFYATKPPEDADKKPLALPDGNADGDFWAVAGRYDLRDKGTEEYIPPKGLYVTLTHTDEGDGWKLLGPNNSALTFDGLGRLVEIADRLRQRAPEDKVQGNRIRLYYDGFSRLSRVVDDYGRHYHLRYDDDPDSANFGLLETLEDFAGREVQYRYRTGNDRILERVEPPEVRPESLAPGATGDRFISYAYDPANYGNGAILHGPDFAGRRLQNVKLPGGGGEPRITLDYWTGTGRLSTVDLPDVSGSWQIGWVEDGTPSRVSEAIITSPWSATTYYTVHHEGINLGRLDKVSQSTPFVPDGWVPTGANQAPPSSPSMLSTTYFYTDDGSGRVKEIVAPDGGRSTFDHRATSRVAELGVTKITRSGGAGSLDTTIDYKGAPDNLPAAIIDGRTRRQLVTPRSVTKESDLTTVRRGFESDAVPQLSDLVYNTSGQLKEANIGVNSLKAGGPGLEKVTLEYLPAIDGAGGGEGFLESIQQEDGPVLKFTDYDEYGNATVLERSASRGAMATTRRIFDEWDQAYGVTVAANGRPGVQQTLTAKHDLRGRVRETTRTQVAVGQVVTTSEYTERGQVDSVTTSGHAGPVAGSSNGATHQATTDYQYSPATGLLDDVISARNNPTHLGRDSVGRVTSIELPPASGQSVPTVLYRGYDRMERVVYLTDGHEGWWRGVYNELGQLEKEYVADGRVLTRNYDVAGGLARVEVEGPDGDGGLQTLAVTRYDVASFGAITDVQEEGLSTGTRHTHIAFDEAGRLAQIDRGADGGSMRREYRIDYTHNADGHRRKSIDAAGNYTNYIFPGSSPWPESVVRHEIDPAGGPEIIDSLDLTYDLRGRPIHVATNNGLSLSRSYDETGNLLSQELDGPVKRRTVLRWDGWSHILEAQRADLTASSTLYGYDLDGNLLERAVLRSGGVSELTTMSYDGQGLMKQRALPGATTEEFLHNPDGTVATWLTRQLNLNGQRLSIAFDYDPVNRLTSRYIDNAVAFTNGGLPDGLAAFSEVGDTNTYDGLGRTTSMGRLVDPVSGSVEAGSFISLAYQDGDPRALPISETVGQWQDWWPGSDAITRVWDAYDRLENLSGPDAQLGTRDFLYDDLDQRTDVTTSNGDRFHGHYTWAGTGRLFGLNAGNLQQTYSYLPTDSSAGPLLSGLAVAYGDQGTFGDLSALGAFDYRWAADAVKQGRDVIDAESVFAEMGWGWAVDASHRLIAASAGNAPCDADGDCPDAQRSWEWTGFGPADEMLGWIDHFDTRYTVTATGANGRMLELEHEGANGTTTESFGYDAVGRRISDGRQDYLWSWRGELTEVELTSGDRTGYTAEFSYDASGRLLERTEYDEAGAFLSKRGFLWNGWELLAEVGLNFDDESIWQIEHLPGPGGLDDSPQLAVTTHIHPSDPADPLTRYFDLVRDEMGTVLAVLEDVEAPPGGDGIPPLKARILYDPYGQAHVEEGPELRLVEHDSAATSVDGVPQDVLDQGPADNPVVGIAGSLVVTTSMALDEASVAAGLILERWDPGAAAYLPLGPAELAVARDDTDATTLEVMPVAGWLEGERYRLRLTTALADAYGRAFVPPEGEVEYTQTIAIPAEVEATDDPLPSLPREIPLIFDNAKAAAATLDCDGEPCFPGGINLLFQGLWTDPVTGISYARNRWYDARNASWLSEDPKGAVDSPNLYAFVGWGPQAARDPMGMSKTNPAQPEWHHLLPNEPAVIDALQELKLDRNSKEFGVLIEAAAHRLKATGTFYTDFDNIHQSGWNSAVVDLVEDLKQEGKLTKGALSEGLQRLRDSDQFNRFFDFAIDAPVSHTTWSKKGWRGRPKWKTYYDSLNTKIGKTQYSLLRQEQKARKLAAAAASTSGNRRRVPGSTRRLARLRKGIPVVGACLSVWSFCESVEARGWGWGTANEVLDSTPIGLGKVAIEVATGIDFIMSTQETERVRAQLSILRRTYGGDWRVRHRHPDLSKYFVGDIEGESFLMIVDQESFFESLDGEFGQ